ncbi:MAG: lysophospholipid acyltransferase family protein [Rhizomicrobium sp.]
MTVFRSTLFLVWFVLATVVLNLGFLPALLLPRRASVIAGRTWAAATLWGLRIFAGLRFEVRGTPPRGAVLVASKHMSMWDTLALYTLLDAPMIVLKRELLNIPFYGWYAHRAGVISIDREGHASALRQMAADAKKAFAAGDTVMIFPEGHRQPPGAPPDYKPGVAMLYSQFGAPCVPVALNSGLFWTGPGGFLKRSGTIVVEFLPPIPPGLKRPEFMRELQTGIETATAALVVEGRRQLVG